MRATSVLPATADDDERKPDKVTPAQAETADDWRQHARELAALRPTAPEINPTGDDLEPHSDEAFALAFSARHADDLRYCDQFKAWFRWDGARWRRDSVRAVFTLARALCRDRAALVDQAHSAAVTSAKMRAAVVALACEDPRHVTASDDWDADPWALNTPGGTVDLRTGRLHPHNPAALHSKITAATPDAGIPCPIWRRFLDDVTAGDIDLQAYLARLTGYALTGSTREHALAFLYGTGGNGKGVFLNTLTALFGDYARVSPMETFTDSKSDRHPTDIAMLMGARLVTAQETEDGRHWAESKIKSMTGGDPVSARFMRADFFTYVPQFKLLFAGNHKPSLRNVDEAIRRRFHLVPFVVEIPAEKRDPELCEKLREEWPAILAWAVAGCLEWQRIGLAPPPAVLDASEEYFAAEDSFGTWLSECCACDQFAFETTRDLFAAWKAWAERGGFKVGTETRFAENMTARGFAKKRAGGKGARGFEGIRINRRDYTDDPRYGA